MWFLGRFKIRSFVPLPRVRGLITWLITVNESIASYVYYYY